MYSMKSSFDLLLLRVRDAPNHGAPDKRSGQAHLRNPRDFNGPTFPFCLRHKIGGVDWD